MTQVTSNKKPVNDLEDLFGPIVHAYTRQNALDDGVLVDVTETAVEAGIKFPVAVTRAVWDRYIEWTSDDTDRQTYQDEAGRLWDVIWMARIAIMSTKSNTSQLLYELNCILRGGKARKAARTTLKLILGPGDKGEAVITILLPNED